MDIFPPKTLALDFGTKRIGLAVSHASLAEPLVILENNDSVWKRLQDICSQESVEQLLIGISENQMAAQTQAFATQLQSKLHLPVIFTDETLSSHSTHQKLQESGRENRGIRTDIDQFAAASFLQEWLDEYMAKNETEV